MKKSHIEKVNTGHGDGGRTVMDHLSSASAAQSGGPKRGETVKNVTPQKLRPSDLLKSSRITGRRR